MTRSKPTYEELEMRLAVAEPIVEALKRHQVDAVIGEEKITFLLLREVGEALLTSEAAFNAMFELSGIGMIQADAPDLRISRVNQKFCDIMGYSAEILLGMTYVSMTHPLDRPRDLLELGRVIRGETDSWTLGKRCLRKDGSPVWVNVSGTALRDHDGRVIKIVAMISEMTDQKQMPQQSAAVKPVKAASKNRPIKKAANKPAHKSAAVKSSTKPSHKKQ